MLWIAGEAARQELIFDNEALARYRKRLYPQAVIHDSRAGLASLYRYAPRMVDMEDRHGGVPVAHHSVVEKMTAGGSGYAPVVLPESFRVFPSNGAGWVGQTAYGKRRDPEVFARLAGLIGQRKGTNWLTIGLVMVLMALPIWDWYWGIKVEPSSLVRSLSAVLGGLVPGWAVTWVEVLLARWWLSAPVLLAIWAIYNHNATLAYRIRDRAGKLWTAPD
jgi:hypothetical protein